jgi:transcriptional regulator with XRE-family HTH domain
MKDIQRQVGLRVRQLRESKGLSQEELAGICGLHRTYIGLIERGERNLSISTVGVVADGLGVPAADLFSTVAPTPVPNPKTRAVKSLSLTDLMSHIHAIRQILIEAKLTDLKRYEHAFRTAQKGSAT